MKARYFLFALAVLSFAACTPKDNPNTPDFKAALSVSGATDNAIAVVAEAKTVSLTVKANVSWEASCNVDWVTVEPNSAVIEDKQETTTKVSVSVAANEAEEARTATLTIKGEGVDDVVLTVNQAAKAAPEKTAINVWDTEAWAPVENPSVELDYSGEAVSLIINAEGDWTATCPDWITLTPAENKYDGENINVTVAVSAAENTTDEIRSGEIKFTGDFSNELVVAVSQNPSVSFAFTDVEVEHTYSDATIKVVPSSDEIYWRAAYGPKELTETQFVDFILNGMNSNLAKFTPEQILDGMALKGEYTYEYTELDPSTDYKTVAVCVAYDEASSAFVAVSLPGAHNFSTTAAPVAEQKYNDIAGVYQCKVYDYFGKVDLDMTMVVEPEYLNETYFVYFTDDVVTPVSGNYVDTYVGVYSPETNGLYIPNFQIGSLEDTWNVGDLGSCACALIWDVDAEEGVEVPELDNVPFVLSEDKTTLDFGLALPEEAMLYVQGLWVNYTGGEWVPTDYACGIGFFLYGTSFTKVQSLSSASQSAKPAIRVAKELETVSLKSNSKYSVKF